MFFYFALGLIVFNFRSMFILLNYPETKVSHETNVGLNNWDLWGQWSQAINQIYCLPDTRVLLTGSNLTLGNIMYWSNLTDDPCTYSD